uniref:Proteasome subunit beta type-1 n=1 Tax=Caligus rogercresseyi TaxID=217165 RepID=C1BRJ9_CALRO|nr:Proteasome subunit beta type-1 precursor [Caligus rogercresseyi]|eukprot:TRINITY_DN158_c0_g1_i1.p1 TRINITY_DN158_c0_g1~~TRINITY_DN158_c0_g1_i1.p1  ORF type:complete len:262 (+),score=66.81 TRINITY_DN158_c0_g1_i1:71-787(+)
MKLLGIESVVGKSELSDYTKNPHQLSFQPYQDNGGTTVGIAGSDFVVIASDTRLASSYDILSRNVPKIFELGSGCVLGSCGCWCDVLTFIRVAESKLKDYHYTHGKELNTPALAQMLSNTLYRRRFFPYYIHNVLAGLDEKGQGVIYTYDPVGHCEKVKMSCGGTSMELIQPILDNIVEKKNMTNGTMKDLSIDETVNIIHDCFISAAERQIQTGDGIMFKIITKEGIETKSVGLRRD